MADGGELDPTVARLRLCVEQGREITVEGEGFRLGDDLVVPQVRRGGCPVSVRAVLSADQILKNTCKLVYMISCATHLLAVCISGAQVVRGARLKMSSPK